MDWTDRREYDRTIARPRSKAKKAQYEASLSPNSLQAYREAVREKWRLQKQQQKLKKQQSGRPKPPTTEAQKRKEADRKKMKRRQAKEASRARATEILQPRGDFDTPAVNSGANDEDQLLIQTLMKEKQDIELDAAELKAEAERMVELQKEESQQRENMFFILKEQQEKHDANELKRMPS